MSVRAIGRFSTWLIAPLVCLAVNWDGLFTWFQADDFAFLGLHRDVFGWSSFWKTIFTPSLAQGSFRPLSERAFFLLFWRWFGLDPFPYHVMIFATQIGSLLLLYWIVFRITRSPLAAVLAPAMWTVHPSLGDALGWTCYFNEVLCAFFLLAALSLWIKFEESGCWRYYWLQAIVFVLGFGALELNIVYPALAAAWAILRGRRRMATLTLPLCAISLAYYIVHTRIAHTPASGPYRLHFDASLLSTLGAYWKWTFVAPFWELVPGYSRALVAVTLLLFSASIFLFLGSEARKRNFVPAFFAVWFLVLLSPLLPLRDHQNLYYLTIPTIGIATLLSLLAVRHRAGIAIVAVYLASAIPAARAGERFLHDQGETVRNLVLGVKNAIDRHPGKTILLTNVSGELYGAAIVHRPFRVFSDTGVYLAPEMLTQHGIIDRDWPPVATFALQPGPTLHALREDQLEVYSAAGARLRNVTQLYNLAVSDTVADTPPTHVDVGNALDAYLLGPGWYPLEGVYRWMMKRASVSMGGPSDADQKLVVSGMCVQQLSKGGPASITAYVDGAESGAAQLPRAGGFQLEFLLPVSSIGKQAIQVELEVSRTFSDSKSGREVSLVFGTWEIR